MKNIGLFCIFLLLAACQTTQKACERHPIPGNQEFLSTAPMPRE